MTERSNLDTHDEPDGVDDIQKGMAELSSFVLDPKVHKALQVLTKARSDELVAASENPARFMKSQGVTVPSGRNIAFAIHNFRGPTRFAPRL